MERESFEDPETADVLNRHFVSIKVDKEERPDIDSVYMAVCQALTQSGGWPLTIIMTPDKKPFFAGTYFPKYRRMGINGLIDILLGVHSIWTGDRPRLLGSANEIVSIVKSSESSARPAELGDASGIIESAVSALKRAFDRDYGGFGRAPKFPTPHNLLFLLRYHEISGDFAALGMVEKTLVQMYKGGIFDHIGYGFSRYSTDRKWLAPHFEKMLYDNALLIWTYARAYELTGDELYRSVADKTFEYISRELTGPDGEFYCAQDADSDGIEGRFYVFTPDEIISLLGAEDGHSFNSRYDITNEGNFEGKNIPNLIGSDIGTDISADVLKKLRDYRTDRAALHKDDKALSSWNGLMIAALSNAGKIFNNTAYLNAAQKAAAFVEGRLSHGSRLYTSRRGNICSDVSFLDDYAYNILAMLELYSATLCNAHLSRAVSLARAAESEFFDTEHGGYYLSQNTGDELFYRPRESHDGAIPSGNSVMAYCLFLLSRLADGFEDIMEKQAAFMTGQAKSYPHSYSFFNLAMLNILHPPKEVVCVPAAGEDLGALRQKLCKETGLVRILEHETSAYKLKDGRTTFYVCEGSSCKLPVNVL